MSLSVRGSFVCLFGWLVGVVVCVCSFLHGECVCVGVLVSLFFSVSLLCVLYSLFLVLHYIILYLQYPCLPTHPIPSYLYCFSSLSTLLLFTLSILPMCIPFNSFYTLFERPSPFSRLSNPLSYHSHLLPILSILSILFVLSIPSCPINPIDLISSLVCPYRMLLLDIIPWVSPYSSRPNALS